MADRRLNMEDMSHVRVARCGQPKSLDGGEEIRAILGAPSAIGKGVEKGGGDCNDRVTHSFVATIIMVSADVLSFVVMACFIFAILGLELFDLFVWV